MQFQKYFGDDVIKCTFNCKFILFCRYNLGKVLESLGEFDTASDCMATALEVEITNPILPFSSIPLTFD